MYRRKLYNRVLSCFKACLLKIVSKCLGLVGHRQKKMPVTRLLLFTKKINTITHNNKMTNPPDSSTISDVTPTDPVSKHAVI